MNTVTELSEADRAATPLVEIRRLRTGFLAGHPPETIWAVDGVSLDVHSGEVLGLVGESGSGKSVTALSVLRLIPQPPGKIAEGEILLRGRNLLKLSTEQMRKVRGAEIGMIFQEPMTSLNPVFTIGMQMLETVRAHLDVSRGEARDRSLEMLTRVGIPDAPLRLRDYPHQFSGGMRQRVMIAMALVCEPHLLIADEPTTALDVTTQDQVLQLMLDLKAQRNDNAILLITHDLAVVAETCDRVAVMYGGKLQEVAPVKELFANPLHPYTRGLLNSLPARHTQPKTHLPAIGGNVPGPLDMPRGCRFCTRCPEVFEPCEDREPELLEVEAGHFVRCHLMSEEGR